MEEQVEGNAMILFIDVLEVMFVDKLYMLCKHDVLWIDIILWMSCICFAHFLDKFKLSSNVVCSSLQICWYFVQIGIEICLQFWY